MDGGTDRHTFLVEHYWPGVTEEQFRSAAEQVSVAAEGLAAGSTAIRFLHSTLVPEDEAAFCVLDAPSAEAVAEAYERAGVRFERILAAVDLRRGGSATAPSQTRQNTEEAT